MLHVMLSFIRRIFIVIHFIIIYLKNTKWNINLSSAKEKDAAVKQLYTFLAPLTNEQPCEAGRKSAKARVRE